jgi:hypothetical protein
LILCRIKLYLTVTVSFEFLEKRGLKGIHYCYLKQQVDCLVRETALLQEEERLIPPFITSPGSSKNDSSRMRFYKDSNFNCERSYSPVKQPKGKLLACEDATSPLATPGVGLNCCHNHSFREQSLNSPVHSTSTTEEQ